MRIVNKKKFVVRILEILVIIGTIILLLLIVLNNSSSLMGISGILSAQDITLASVKPTLIPVNEPGPLTINILSISFGSKWFCFSIVSISFNV